MPKRVLSSSRSKLLTLASSSLFARQRAEKNHHPDGIGKDLAAECGVVKCFAANNSVFTPYILAKPSDRAGDLGMLISSEEQYFGSGWHEATLIGCKALRCYVMARFRVGETYYYRHFRPQFQEVEILVAGTVRRFRVGDVLARCEALEQPSPRGRWARPASKRAV